MWQTAFFLLSRREDDDGFSEEEFYITVFHHDRIDDHVVYDEVRYVRFAATR